MCRFPDPAQVALWATDDGVRKSRALGRPPQFGLVWSKYRGPGTVHFSESAPKVGDSGRAVTTAMFDEPGEYVLRALAWDDSGPQRSTMASGVPVLLDKCVSRSQCALANSTHV